MVFSTGYDMGNEFKFGDGLGMMYTGIAIAWSLLLLCGAIFLALNRDLPFLRIRNVALVISAVAILHVYWVLCFLAYGMNGYFPCATEFWIMNIYLPLGIALFHASNTQLLHVAAIQRKYTDTNSLPDEKETLMRHRRGWRHYSDRIRSYRALQRTLLYIGMALGLQLIIALVIFFISRKFHNGFGLVGEANPATPLTKRDCRKGWEWILSVAWQFFWSWIYAPYLLWKVRNVRDIHGWRVQTVICCVAGLPASPMWLLALYLPRMSVVNRYFIPPLWFVPSIFLIQSCMIFLPCWHIIQHRRLKKETLEIIAEWEKQNSQRHIECSSVQSPHPSRLSHKSSTMTTSNNRKAHSHMYTSATLEKALQTNSTPLLVFAAMKDFSGENISFLNYVREWKQNWQLSGSSSPRSRPYSTEDDYRVRQQQFVRAVGIYSSFVSLRYSSFPINISHGHLKELEALFEEAAVAVNAKNAESLNSVTPFDDLESAPGQEETSTISSSMGACSVDELIKKAGSKKETVINVYKMKNLDESSSSAMPIPTDFGPNVFDHAAESVKYMVLTNTWPKFVDAGYAANIDRSTAMDRFHERLGGCGVRRSSVASF